MSSSLMGLREVPRVVWERRFDGIRVHDRGQCSALNPAMTGLGNGHCPFDLPSQHKMREWPMSIRVDRSGLIERHCEHSVGHPDPDSVAFLYVLYPSGRWDVHGCDGCCGG